MILRALSGDHVGRDRPGRACEPQHGDIVRQGCARQPHGFVNRIEPPRRRFQRPPGTIQQRRRQPGALTRLEPQVLAKGVRNHQNVREQDRSVKPEAPHRLERDLGRRLAVVSQRQETPLPLPQLAVFGKVSPRLAHEPQRHPLAPSSVQRIEQQAGHRARVQSNKTKIIRGMMESVGPVESGDSGALPDFSRLG